MTATLRSDFVDVISGTTYVVAVDQGVPFFDSAKVEHPGCEGRADVSADLDCFYCTVCRLSGRISGAWVFDLWNGAYNGRPATGGEV